MKEISKCETLFKRFIKGTTLSFTMASLVAFMINGKIYGSVFQDETILEKSRIELNSEISELIKKTNKNIFENKNQIKNIDLQILQLLEQGEQVIKPIDHSWQLGVNYWWTKSKGNAYKYYPYAQAYNRDSDIFIRVINKKIHENIEPISDIGYQELLKKEDKLKEHNSSISRSYAKNNGKNDEKNFEFYNEKNKDIKIVINVNPKAVTKELKSFEPPKDFHIEGITKKEFISYNGEINTVPHIEINKIEIEKPKPIEVNVPVPAGLSFIGYSDYNFGGLIGLDDYKIREKLESFSKGVYYSFIGSNYGGLGKIANQKKLMDEFKLTKKELRNKTKELKNDPEIIKIFRKIKKYSSNTKQIEDNILNGKAILELAKRDPQFENKMNTIILEKDMTAYINLYPEIIKKEGLPYKLSLPNSSILLEKYAGSTHGEPGDKDFYQFSQTWPTAAEKEKLIFKTNYIDGGGNVSTNSVSDLKDLYSGTSTTKTPDEISREININSYNLSEYDKEITKVSLDIMYSGVAIGRENMFDSAGNDDRAKSRNRQYFLVGGSRGIEYDDGKTPADLLPGFTINMGGPLVFGIAKQDTGAPNPINNYGVITDIKEKDDLYIKNMPLDTEGYLDNKYVSKINGSETDIKDMRNEDGKSILLGPKSVRDDQYQELRIKKSTDGYIGYKVGMAQIEEDTVGQGLINKGTIDFRGGNSIGMYIYLPTKIDLATRKGEVDNTNSSSPFSMINDRGNEWKYSSSGQELTTDPIASKFVKSVPASYTGTISLSGENSYGMKYAAQQKEDNYLKFENRGDIILQKNPDGIDKADHSVGIGVTVDDSFKTGRFVIAKKGIIKNTSTGVITLKDNIENSVGMYINIASDLTNDGTIKISAQPEDENKQNVGMYAKQAESMKFGKAFDENTYNGTEVINNGSIIIDGNHAFGMVADGAVEKDSTSKYIAKASNNNNISTGEESNNIFGMVAKDGGYIENKGNILLLGKNANGGMYISENSSGKNYNKIEGPNLDATKNIGVINYGTFSMIGNNSVKVSGQGGIAILTSGGNANSILTGNITADNGSTALYNDGGNLDLSNLDINVGVNGLLYYGVNTQNKVKLGSNIRATVGEGGTAFYVTTENIDDIFTADNPAEKIYLTLSPNSTFSTKVGGEINLSKVQELETGVPNSIGNRIIITPTSRDYILYSLNKGTLNIDGEIGKVYDYDNPIDPINKQKVISSNIIVSNGVTLQSAKDGKIALSQGNFTGGTVDSLKIENRGIIKLTGNSIDSTPTSKGATTTGIAGEFITLNNSGKIEILGDKGIGIFGVAGSNVNNSGEIKVGPNGFGLFAMNKLGDIPLTLGDGIIKIVNSGTITGENGSTGIYGDNSDNVANSTITNDSIIDFANKNKTFGIYAKNVDFTGTTQSRINLGENSTGIYSVTGSIIDKSTIDLGTGSTGYLLEGDFTGNNKSINLGGIININGDNTNLIYIKNGIISNIQENLTVNINNHSYDYFALENSDFSYNQDKELNGSNFNFINASNSNITLNSTVNVAGNNIFVIKEMNTLGSNKKIIIDTNGSIDIKGNQTTGIYANNTEMEFKGRIKVDGENSYGIYKEGESTLKFDGTIATNNGGIALNLIGNLANAQLNGNINLNNNSKGIVATNLSPEDLTINTNINGKGIGIFAKKANDPLTIKSTGTIEINGTDAYQGIGMYAEKDAIGTTLENNGTINVGDNSIGIAGYNIKSGTNSNLNVSTGQIGVLLLEETNSGNNQTTIDLSGNINLANGKVTEDIDHNVIEEFTVGVYSKHDNSNISLNNSNFTLGKNSIGLVLEGKSNKLTSSVPTVDLKGNSIFIYAKDKDSNVITNPNTSINITGDNNYGFYTFGDLTNNSNIDLTSGKGNIAIYSLDKEHPAINSGIINIASPDSENRNIGMVAGGNGYSGKIVNKGTLNVGDDSIGMYAKEDGIVTNEGIINVNGNNAIGIYLAGNAIGENRGTINVNGGGSQAIHISEDAIIKNYGHIVVSSSTGIAVAAKNNKSKEDIEMEVDATGQVELNSGIKIKKIQSGGFSDFTENIGRGTGIEIVGHNGISEVKKDGKIVVPTIVNKENDNLIVEAQPNIVFDHNNQLKIVNEPNKGAISKLGMYVDTSGTNITNPIEGLENLGIKEADLIIGTEVTNYTNSESIRVGEGLLAPYNDEIRNSPSIENWRITSSSLTWVAHPGELNSDNTFKNIILTKIPYVYALDDKINEYNFLVGMDDRYTMNNVFSREKMLFNKLNTIGKNEPILFIQAVYEMLGNQYVNTSRRLADTKKLYNREFDEVMSWGTITKDTSKVKVFGEKKEYKSNGYGSISYDRNAQGVFVLNNNETVRLGDSEGWFYGLSVDNYKFKDIGGSKEKAFTGQLGYHIRKAYGHNRDSNYLIKFGIEGSYRNMDRKYLVVDDIFGAKSKYYTYGVFADMAYSKEYRASEGIRIEPKVGLNLGVQQISNIKEKKGEMRLDLDKHNMYTVEPNVSINASHSQSLNKGNLITSLDFGISKNIAISKEKNYSPKVAYTSASRYTLPKYKESSNVELLTKINWERDDFGVAIMAGYNFREKAKTYGLEGKIKF